MRRKKQMKDKMNYYIDLLFSVSFTHHSWQFKMHSCDYDQSVTSTYQNTVQERREPYKRVDKTIINKKHLLTFRLTYKKRETMI